MQIIHIKQIWIFPHDRNLVKWKYKTSRYVVNSSKQRCYSRIAERPLDATRHYAL